MKERSQPKATNRKRKSPSNEEPGPKKRNVGVKATSTSSTKELTKKTESADAVQDGQKQPEKPRLTTPDIEFDFDRSQLRDPRPTPGRKTRPRYDDRDIPDDLRAHLEATRDIFEPEKPKGRLTSFGKNELFIQKSLANPLQSFHHLYRCYEKGPDGSPTYDEAGFQLDYDKVAQWKNPRAYRKPRMVRNMERAVEKAKSEEDLMFELFFETLPADRKNMSHIVKDYLKDHMSKELGIPWHQIQPVHVQAWRDKGFQPVKYEEWWKEPTPVESKRMSKMMSGASLRKII